MAKKGKGLAARFRAAAKKVQQRDEVEHETRAARLARAVAARDELFEDLVALGADLPLSSSKRTPHGVVYRVGEEFLAFNCVDDSGDVWVDYRDRAEQDEHRLYRETALGDRWVWRRRRRGREDRLPLFDQALELLLVHGLGLADPDAPMDEEPHHQLKPMSAAKKRRL